MVAWCFQRDWTIYQAMSSLWTVCYSTKRTNDVHSIDISPMGESRCGLIWTWQNLLQYLITVDYFSWFPEVIKFTSTTSRSIIIVLKVYFFLVTECQQLYLVITDHNLPLLKWKSFWSHIPSNHITSSPHYPQSNRLVERTVKTVKQLLRSAPDPYLALLSYQATLIPWCLGSPRVLLMGRQMRGDVPETTDHFILNWHFLADFKEKDGIHKKK